MLEQTEGSEMKGYSAGGYQEELYCTRSGVSVKTQRVESMALGLRFYSLRNAAYRYAGIDITF